MNLGLASFPRGLPDLLTWLVPSGTGMDYWGPDTAIPRGWVLSYGQSVPAQLYPRLAKLWGVNSDGTITFPDKRGRISAGKDNMGGTAANRITTAGSGVDGSTLRAAGGAETVTLVTGNLPSHTHTFTSGNQSADHTHSGTTGTVSADHTHTYSGSTGGISANHTHTIPIGTATDEFGGTASQGAAVVVATATSGTVSADHTHAYSGTTSGFSANHTHSITTGGVSANHTHTGTTDATGSATAINKLNPVIICNYIIKT